MAHTLLTFLLYFFRHYGVWAVFIFVFLENAGLPVPGETSLLMAAFFAHRGVLHLPTAVAVAAVASILGSILGYHIGRWGGKAFVERHHRKMLISPRVFGKVRALFLKYAEAAVFFARFVDGLRIVFGLLAGAWGMPLRRFLLFSTAGAIAWSITIGSVGYWVGSSRQRLIAFHHRMEWIGLLVLAAMVVFAYLMIKRGIAESVQDD
ncbi:MAG TPA: DedA family protein [Terriglobia bacterium]|nr:DedA family protein [Terriglobia bacterium]